MLKLRGGNVEKVNAEITELEEEKQSLQLIPTWKSFFHNRVLYRATVVAIMIQIAQQLCGKLLNCNLLFKT